MRKVYSVIVSVLIAGACANIVLGQEVRAVPFTVSSQLPNGSKIQEINVRVDGISIREAVKNVSECENGIEFSLGPNSIVEIGRLPLFIVNVDDGKAVELVPDQVKELTNIKNEFLRQLKSEVVKKIGANNGKLDRLSVGEIRSQTKANQVEFEKRAFKVLLPFQVEMLQKKHFTRLFNESPSSFFSLPFIKSELSIDDKVIHQSKELEKTANKQVEEIKSELLVELKKLAAEKKAEILDVLTAEQVSMLEELLNK